MPRYANDLATLLSTGQSLLQPELPIEIRLMGVRMSNFQEHKLETGQRSIASFVSQAAAPNPEQQQQQAQQLASRPGGDSTQAAAGLGELEEEDDGISAAVEDEHRDWDSLDPEHDGQARRSQALPVLKLSDS